jgi:hypothetical protein
MQASATTGIALVQCGDHWENQQRILGLALGLRERGWVPVVMTYANQAGALFLRHGVDVCPLRRFIQPPGVKPIVGSLRSEISLREVYEIERQRAPQRFATLLRRGLRVADLLRRTDALSRLLSALRPEKVYVWNGLTGVVANVLRQLCQRRQIRCAFLERGLLPNSVFVDPRGTGGRSQLARTTMPESPAASPPPSRPTHLRGRRILVPLQVERDTNILYDSPVATMHVLLERIADAAPPESTIVARRHPEEITASALPQRPNLVYDDGGTIEEQCARADLVLTINSTVGLTALFAGRPVLALGRATYTGKGLCVEPQLDHLAQALAYPATYQPPAPERVAAFRQLLLDDYTASRDHLPAQIEQHIPPRRAEATFNPYGIQPQVLARHWQTLVQAARSAAQQHERVVVDASLAADATLALTYRKQVEPISQSYLRAGAAQLLEIDPDRVAFAGSSDDASGVDGPSRPDASGVDDPSRSDEGLWLVVCPQDQPPPQAVPPALVVDPYFEPHIRWLQRQGSEL